MKLRINIAILSMIAVVAASNYLVEIPINDWLTWGAFSYPISFLITELTNYYYGQRAAQRVVYVGFSLAVVLSLIFANPHIALASGMAFLSGQLLDISVFTRLRRKAWWLAPFSASVLGSLVDTLIFFTIAFWGQGRLIVTLGMGDLFIKLCMDIAMLLPFRMAIWRQALVARLQS